jgi:UDP-glucose:glycoprotein glucosyltransferase
MYERLLRIMMLSVTRHTSKPVKFWLFENYLSPTFKEIASEMSKEYGFQVAYVTYKWPQWLTPQTQQQRIIWGFKILFLDVLFPLDVKKVSWLIIGWIVIIGLHLTSGFLGYLCRCRPSYSR